MQIEVSDRLLAIFIADCKCKDYLFKDIVNAILDSNEYYTTIRISNDKLFSLLNCNKDEYMRLFSEQCSKIDSNNFEYLKNIIDRNDCYYAENTPQKANVAVIGIKKQNIAGNYIIATIEYNPGRFYANESCEGNYVLYKHSDYPFYKVDTEHKIKEDTIVFLD